MRNEGREKVPNFKRWAVPGGYMIKAYEKTKGMIPSAVYFRPDGVAFAWQYFYKTE